MSTNKLKNLVVLVLVIASVTSCVPRAKRSTARLGVGSGDFRVSVVTDGQEVKDFETRLVQYVNLRPEDVDSLMTPQGRLSLPFDGIMEVDGKGQPNGFRVVDIIDPTKITSLGLAEGDIVTAIGTMRCTNIGDMEVLVKALKTSGREAISLLRDGRVHKILYFVQK